MKETYYKCLDDKNSSVLIMESTYLIIVCAFDDYREVASVKLTPEEAIELGTEILDKAHRQKRLADDSKAKTGKTDH